MTRRAPKLPPPTMEERQAARQAAAIMRAVIADPSKLGEPFVGHVDLSRPKRSYWFKSWASLPGLTLVNGRYQHACLPGWEYSRDEIVKEMIPDLEALAERGRRPTEVTS